MEIGDQKRSKVKTQAHGQVQRSRHWRCVIGTSRDLQGHRTKHCKALISLRQNNDILILPADKGKATVIIDKTDYDKKIIDLLENKETYELLN